MGVRVEAVRQKKLRCSEEKETKQEGKKYCEIRES